PGRISEVALRLFNARFRRLKSGVTCPRASQSRGRCITEEVCGVCDGHQTIEVATGGITANDVRGTRVAVANVAGTYYQLSDTRRRGDRESSASSPETFSVQ